MKATTGIKKLFSLLLCMCMLLSMNSPAFAAEVEEITCTHDAATEPVAPTCITPGNENVVCSLCGELIDNSIPATGIHNYVDGKCTNDGCGLECSHNYVEDAEAYVAPTCTTDGKKVMSCSVCGAKTEDVLPAGHSWGEGVVTTEPTCADAGVKTYTCSGCGETKTEDIDATGIHNYVNGICANDSCGLIATCNKAEDCPALSHEADCLSQLCDKCGLANHVGSCVCDKEADCPAADDAHEADCVKHLTDETNKAKIAEVDALIAALPDVVTSGNYDSVMAQLYVIKAKETELGAELWSQVDHAKLNAVILATQAPLTADECTCTAKCDATTTACLFCKNGGTCPKKPAVAKIGEVGYDSLQSAVDAAKNGDVVTLCQDVSEPVTVTQKPGVAFTIDGAGKTMTNSITVDGKSARYPTAGLTIRNINFSASSVTGEAFINLGVSGDNNTRYTSNVSVQGCSFSSTGNKIPCIKSYTGGDTNLSVIGCTANAGTHSLLQVDNVEGKLTISGNKVYSKNGINLNSSGNVEITNNDIRVSGYAVRTGASSGTAVTPSIVLSGNTLATDNSEGDPVIVVRSTTESATITMSDNSVSGNTHIGGNTANTTINADGNYWDGEKAPKTSGTSVEVLTYYSDAERTDLVVSPNVIASIGDELYLSLQEANTDATSGDTIILLKDITLEGIVHLEDGVTLDLNGKNLFGTVTGKLSVNGGSWTTKDSHSYNMVCSGTNTDKADYFYISDDGVFDANVHGALSVLSGTVTVSKNARTVPGQTVTIASGASFIVPTGKEFEVLGNAIVNGTVVVDGTVILGSDIDDEHVAATKEASLTAPAGLNVVSGIDGYTVLYDGSKYSIAPASTAPIVATIGGNNFSTLQAALDAAKDGDTVELESSVSENATVKSDITLKLNGNTVGGISVGSDALTNIPTLTISASDAASIADGIDLVWGYVEIGGNALGAKSGNVKSDSNGNMTLVLPTANDNLAFAGAYQILPHADNSAVTSKADGTLELPANSTVVLTDKHSVYIVNSGAQIDKNGKLSLLPFEVTDMTGKSFGYAVTIVSETVGESSSDDAILSPLHPEAGDPYKLTITPGSNGELVYDCPDAKEDPIVDDKADGKDYLKFIKKDKYFYKYGAGRMYFTCNGFMDCLKNIKVDGKELDSRTDYILDRGSTIVTLRNGYLKNLALGKHTLTLTYEDGQSISTEFTVGETPATGDSGYGIFAAGMGISLMGMLCVLFVLKKKRANN